MDSLSLREPCCPERSSVLNAELARATDGPNTVGACRTRGGHCTASRCKRREKESGREGESAFNVHLGHLADDN